MKDMVVLGHRVHLQMSRERQLSLIPGDAEKEKANMKGTEKGGEKKRKGREKKEGE